MLRKVNRDPAPLGGELSKLVRDEKSLRANFQTVLRNASDAEAIVDYAINGGPLPAQKPYALSETSYAFLRSEMGSTEAGVWAVSFKKSITKLIEYANRIVREGETDELALYGTARASTDMIGLFDVKLRKLAAEQSTT